MEVGENIYTNKIQRAKYIAFIANIFKILKIIILILLSL